LIKSQTFNTDCPEQGPKKLKKVKSWRKRDSQDTGVVLHAL